MTRQEAIHIISESFDGNPAIVFSVGRGWGYRFRKWHLASFVYDFCKRRDGVHISSNGKGIICYYHSDSQVSFFTNLWDELCVGLLAIGPWRVWRVLERSRKVKEAQTVFGPHLHCWYFGVLDGYRDFSASAELKNKLYADSQRFNVPVLAETTILQNKRVYERMGFEWYGSVNVAGMETFLLVLNVCKTVR